jgi:cytochrome P450 PksS
LARLDEQVETVSARLIEGVRSRSEIELVSEFATVLPIRIITRMLGVSIADPERFRRFTYALTFESVSGRLNESLVRTKDSFSRKLEELFVKRRLEPRDDLLSTLVRAHHEEDRLTAQELVSLVYLLLIGGFMTTANLIANGIHTLLRHPDQLDRLRRNPDLIDSAVEELLRFESPLEMSAASFASTDIELDGGLIRRGEAVRVVIPSAHRDETIFAEPDRLDIARTPCPHIAFGQGIHFCLGAPLARLEGKIALRMLIERLPNLRVADPSRVEWIPHPVLRGLRRLPLRFDA